MVDYRSYFIDPRQGQAQALNTIANAATFNAQRRQAERQNAFAERRLQMQDEQNIFDRASRIRQEERTGRALEMSEQEQQIKLINMQADMIYKMLGNVNNEQSHQTYRGWLQQMGQSPLGQTDFFQQIIKRTPQNFDPQALEAGKAQLLPLIKAPESGLTGTAKNLEVILNRKPTIQELQDFARETKPETKIELPEEEKSYDKEMGKRYAEDYSEILRASNQAQDNKIRLNRAKGLVTRIETGALKPTTTAIKRVIADLGYDVSKLGLKDDVGLAQALNAVSIDLTMDTVSRTKGAVSNKEMELFAQVAPQLSNTVEGNLLIIEMAQRLNENKIKVAQLARTYTQRNKRFDDGFYAELDKFHTENPLFTDDIYKRVQELAGAAKEAQGRGIVNPPTPNLSDVPDDELLKQLGM